MSKEDNQPGETLTASEQELRLLVETIPALVWRAAPDGKFDYVNQRVLNYFGAPLSEIIGLGMDEKGPSRRRRVQGEDLARNLEIRTPHNVACRLQGVDGRYRSFEVCGEPLRTGDGSVLGWCGVFIDIDDRRMAEDASAEERTLSDYGAIGDTDRLN